MGNENVESGFRAGLQLRDEFGFVTAPRKSAGPIRHAVPFWRGVFFGSGFVSTNLKPGVSQDDWQGKSAH
jgi:hypothetical protein